MRWLRAALAVVRQALAALVVVLLLAEVAVLAVSVITGHE